MELVLLVARGATEQPGRRSYKSNQGIRSSLAILMVEVVPASNPTLELLAHEPVGVLRDFASQCEMRLRPATLPHIAHMSRPTLIALSG